MFVRLRDVKIQRVCDYVKIVSQGMKRNLVRLVQVLQQAFGWKCLKTSQSSFSGKQIKSRRKTFRALPVMQERSEERQRGSEGMIEASKKYEMENIVLHIFYSKEFQDPYNSYLQYRKIHLMPVMFRVKITTLKYIPLDKVIKIIHGEWKVMRLLSLLKVSLISYYISPHILRFISM